MRHIIYNQQRKKRFWRDRGMALLRRALDSIRETQSPFLAPSVTPAGPRAWLPAVPTLA